MYKPLLPTGILSMFHHRCPLAHTQTSMEGGWITSWCNFLNFHLQSHWETTWFQMWWALTCTEYSVRTVYMFTFSDNRDKATKTELNILQTPAGSYHCEHTWKHTKQGQLACSACWVQTISLQSHLVLLDLVEQTSVSQHALSQFWNKSCQTG